MYEPRHRVLLSRPAFHRRLLLHFSLAGGLIAGSLGIGMAGYVFFERLSWLDAFLNSAMLLGGMGPVDMPQTAGGKLFAGLYALYAGLLFLITAGIVFAPVLHRVMHKFHLDTRDS